MSICSCIVDADDVPLEIERIEIELVAQIGGRANLSGIAFRRDLAKDAQHPLPPGSPAS